jgi:Rrf2 family iron-sulfur cluster assembly transcriptional regulator
MKITYRTDYALKALLDLALHYGQQPVSIRDLAGRIDAPVKFLEQVLVDLKRGGFVESRRGNVGGYLLARAPVKITMGDAVRFLEETLEPIACIQEGYSKCRDKNCCVFTSIWGKVERQISETLDNINFEGLVSQVRARQQAFTYSI